MTEVVYVASVECKVRTAGVRAARAAMKTFRPWMRTTGGESRMGYGAGSMHGGRRHVRSRGGLGRVCLCGCGDSAKYQHPDQMFAPMKAGTRLRHCDLHCSCVMVCWPICVVIH